MNGTYGLMDYETTTTAQPYAGLLNTTTLDSCTYEMVPRLRLSLSLSRPLSRTKEASYNNWI